MNTCAQVVLALAEVAELADQVEEGEQREEAEQHEAHRAVDLAREVALEGARCAATLTFIGPAAGG